MGEIQGILDLDSSTLLDYLLQYNSKLSSKLHAM